MNKNANIIFLEHREIDIAKWDDAIEKSLQFRIYATSTWLDCVSPAWAALVLGDYECIMPLPIKRKYGVRYLAQPPYTQQLGIFSKTAVEASLAEKFIARAQELYPFAEINVNGFFGALEDYRMSRNYVLPLIASYNEIKKGFSKSLIKNSLNKINTDDLIYDKKNEIKKAVDFSRKLYNKKMGLPEAAYVKLRKIAGILELEKACFTRQVSTTDKQILAISLFVTDKKRIYNLTSATTQKGRELNANYFLYNELIREYSGTGMLLDFEGSNIPGIEKFYRKFGAVLEPYYFLRWNKLPWPYNLFKK